MSDSTSPDSSLWTTNIELLDFLCNSIEELLVGEYKIMIFNGNSDNWFLLQHRSK